jgi:hypothetical protein
MATGVASLVGQRGQIQPHRPPLGPHDQFLDRSVVEPDTGPLQQGAGLLVVHGQVLGSELHHPTLSTQHRHRQRRPGSGGHQQPGSGG